MSVSVYHNHRPPITTIRCSPLSIERMSLRSCRAKRGRWGSPNFRGTYLRSEHSPDGTKNIYRSGYRSTRSKNNPGDSLRRHTAWAASSRLKKQPLTHTQHTRRSQRNRFLHKGDGCMCVSGPRIDCVVRGGNNCSPFANTVAAQSLYTLVSETKV